MTLAPVADHDVEWCDGAASGTLPAQHPPAERADVHAEASVHIEAPPSQVWDLISDVTRIGRFSPETIEAEWLDGADGPAHGARFRGKVRRNEWGPTYWSVCRVTAYEHERTFGFDVVGFEAGGGESAGLTHWRYELEPSDGGTRLTESMHLNRTWWLDVYDRTVGQLRADYNQRNIETTLGRIKAEVEGTEPPPQTARRSARTMQVSDDVVVDAAPDEVWALVADPTRIPAWSPENTGADTPHPGPLDVGDRFVGHNTRGAVSWATGCTVTASEPGREFAFTVDRYGTAGWRFPAKVASWRFTFEEVEGGTRVTETWRDDRERWPDPVARAFDKVATGGRTFAEFQRRNIRRSLDHLAEAVGSSDGEVSAGSR